MKRFVRVVCLVGLILIPFANSIGQEARYDSRIRGALQPFVDHNTLAGAVTLVASPDKVLHLDAVGWMDVSKKRPMRTDCVFWIASQSKPITCTALMILVDEGKLSVDDRVDRYLPDFADQLVVAEKDDSHQLLKKPNQPLLIRHLMSHTSGLPQSTLLMKPTLDRIPLESTVAGNAMLALGTEPGSKYLYSNPGINTAGRIVELVSGMPFEKFLQTRLFDPLGMNDTTFWPNDEQQSRLAKAYKPTGDQKNLEETPVAQLYYPLDDRTKRHAFPGGGLFSTAIDLSHFYQMLANQGTYQGKRIISEKGLATMTSEQTGDLKAKYGFGFKVDSDSFGHGGAYGTNSEFQKNEKLITIFLVQHAGWSDQGKTILPTFQKVAIESFGVTSAAK